MLSERFYGVGEPLIQREGDTKVAAEAYLDLVKATGCSAYRSWMHLTEVLTDPVTPNTEKVEAHTRLLNRAKELNLEVTGMSHEWFLPVLKPCIPLGCGLPRPGSRIRRTGRNMAATTRWSVFLTERRSPGWCAGKS